MGKRRGIPAQEFSVRSDMACGSTIGPILASSLGCRTVDVGAPQLSMHSIREMCGVDDVGHSYRHFLAFFQVGLPGHHGFGLLCSEVSFRCSTLQGTGHSVRGWCGRGTATSRHRDCWRLACGWQESLLEDDLGGVPSARVDPSDCMVTVQEFSKVDQLLETSEPEILGEITDTPCNHLH